MMRLWMISVVGQVMRAATTAIRAVARMRDLRAAAGVRAACAAEVLGAGAVGGDDALWRRGL